MQRGRERCCAELSTQALPHPSLDHCSGLLPALSLPPPEPLQSLPLAAARAILPNHKSDHITPHSPAPPPSHYKQERSQTPASVLNAACLAGDWKRAVPLQTMSPTLSPTPSHPIPPPCWLLWLFPTSAPFLCLSSFWKALSPDSSHFQSLSSRKASLIPFSKEAFHSTS